MSEGADEGQEKSFEPTERKLQQAREEGNVARSQDVSVAAAYLGIGAAILVGGGAAATRFGGALLPFLDQPERLSRLLLEQGGLASGGAVVGGALLATLPFFLGPAALVLAALIAQRAIVVAPSKLAPKLSRISPLENAKQKFGPSGLVEFAKSAVKMIAIGVAAWLWLWAETPRLISLARADARALPGLLGEVTLSLLAVVTAIALVIAGVDYFWQRFDHSRKLRMSLEEMKKESKETEGDPHVKSERRRRAEEIATNRMLSDVPKANVVIVNPEHYAVALKWSRADGRAPVCVAKGVDEIAAAIRAKASEAGVPIHRDPPTARALHATVEIGQEIRPEHYRAVAASIRFAEEMRRRARASFRP